MKPTWEECAAAGMSAAEAGRARGVTIWAAMDYARRNGLTFRDGRKDNGSSLTSGSPAIMRSVAVRRAMKTMTSGERACYRALRQGPDVYSVEDALRLIGRADLIAQVTK